ncbi:TetR/AcrR family transcriptional regulator [Paenibacillus pinihumi]|uniref:TetR/AcrR family transcriptional regulator n=1 Tax=Paenibacillus pinihumi TaxID=669462 RepID=UPI00041E70BA|nr:TetR/AcrR family transcriptional regulator [Paenibacillus pinihumi]
MKKKDLTSIQLVEAAFELFAEHGLERTSMAMIAQKVGMTKPSIYYHFSTKEELTGRVFDYLFQDHSFNTYFHTASINKNDFAQALYQGGLGMLPRNENDHVAVMRVINEFTILAEREELYRERLTRMHQEFVGGFRQLLTIGAEWGNVPAEQLDHKAHLLALVIDNLSRCMLMRFEMDYPGIWRETVNSVLNEEWKISEANL